MSSTKRGGQRAESDQYPTPPWCVRRLIEKVELPGGRWLEPCAGDGVIMRTISSLRDDVTWSAWELQEEMELSLTELTPRVKIGDCLSLPYKGKPYDVVITNPPFSVATAVLDRMLGISQQVILLLRLNYLGSQDRYDFLSKNIPDAFILPNRPVFGPNQKGKLGTDSIEYAWFRWVSAKPQAAGILRLLGDTPKAERKADQEATWEQVAGVWQRKLVV